MSGRGGDDGLRQRSTLQVITDRLGARWAEISKTATRVYRRAAPAIQTATDYTWFLGSSALLLSLPMLIELQREATVMVLQRQRESEMSAMQEQARALNASTLENVVSSIKMLSGNTPGAPPVSQGGGEDAKR